MHDLPRAKKNRSVVWELSDTLLAHRAGVVVVIEVYLDESGTHSASPVVAVSAVWADKDEWASWADKWDDAKSPIKIHHSVDCHNRKGEFDGWTRAQRDKYVKRILPVIRESNIAGHFAILEKEKILKAIEDRHGVRLPQNLAIEGYYSICFNWAVRSAAEFLRRQGHDNIAFIAETNQYTPSAMSMFNALHQREIVGDSTLAFGSKQSYKPLQCADIVAYEGNRQMRNGHSHERRVPLQAIDPVGDRFGYVMPPEADISRMADITGEFLKSHDWS